MSNNLLSYDSLIAHRINHHNEFSRIPKNSSSPVSWVPVPPGHSGKVRFVVRMFCGTDKVVWIFSVRSGFLSMSVPRYGIPYGQPWSRSADLYDAQCLLTVRGFSLVLVLGDTEHVRPLKLTNR